MPTRNTPILQSIIECLGDQIARPQDALARLEGRFNDSLLIVAGDTKQVAEFAQQLRLAITTPECASVLDHIANRSLAGIHIEIVEDTINTLYEDRFIEP